jgi:hypothetical protein
MLNFEGPLEMGHEPTNTPQNSPNDHLTNTKIWRRHLRIRIAHNTTKNSRPCPPQRIKPSYENFCSMPNREHEAKLAEIKEQDTARIAIRVITNESYPIRSYFMNSNIYDEYATKPNQTHIH